MTHVFAKFSARSRPAPLIRPGTVDRSNPIRRLL